VDVRFGLFVPQDAPFPELAERFRRAEELGFQAAYVADHTRDFRDSEGYWLDGWTVLAALTVRTTSIRIGTLVSNPIIRPPVLLAKEAIAVDHLSGGRLELGIGTGIASFDHAAMGVLPWSPGERAARFAEYVEVVDRVLRAQRGETGFEGRFHRTSGTAGVPGPVQQPRPPITVGGQSPTIRRVAAERADCWNTHGPFGAGVEEILEVTRRQNAELDELCAAGGRDPASLRRSLLLHAALDAWASPRSIEDVVSRFRDAGVGEFVLYWPPDGRADRLERLATEVLPALRA
jgi:alkanesulfonate monooxygenase SsuD/methylene tetrahydromethanopterin reductase-like flavin-dependent oxidoreductase (luciferase family)